MECATLDKLTFDVQAIGVRYNFVQRRVVTRNCDTIHVLERTVLPYNNHSAPDIHVRLPCLTGQFYQRLSVSYESCIDIY